MCPSISPKRLKEYSTSQQWLERNVVVVVVVTGGTLLSSTAWTFGSKLSGLDFYDSRVVILNTKDRTVAIPPARLMQELLAQLTRNTV